MPPERRALLQIHFCVLLWGFTAIFGKLISLPAGQLVAWRMLLVVVVLAPLLRVWRALRAMPPRLLFAYAGIGIVVAFHWLTFYASVKLANASIAAVCMAFAALVTAAIEPLLVGSRFRARDFAFGVAVLGGMLLIAGSIPATMRDGLLVGLLSAVLAGAFMTLNKRWAPRADPLAVTGLELAAGTIALPFLLPLLLLLPLDPAQLRGDGPLLALPSPRDFVLLLALALACTLLPYALALVALRRISAFSAQLAVNLEPLYTMLIAAVLLGETRELGATFYGGAACVVGVVLLHGASSLQHGGVMRSAPAASAAAPARPELPDR